MVISRGFQAWSCPPACYSPTCLYGKVQVQCSHACTCGFSKCISSFYNQQWRKLWVYITGSLIATACHTSGSSTGWWLHTLNFMHPRCTMSIYFFVRMRTPMFMERWKAEPGTCNFPVKKHSGRPLHTNVLGSTAGYIIWTPVLIGQVLCKQVGSLMLESLCLYLWLVMQEAQDNHKQQETLAAVTQHSTHTYTKCGFWSLIEPNQLLATTSSVN